MTHFERMAREWGISDLAKTRRRCDKLVAARVVERRIDENGRPVCRYGCCRRAIYENGLCKSHWNTNRKRVRR